MIDPYGLANLTDAQLDARLDAALEAEERFATDAHIEVDFIQIEIARRANPRKARREGSAFLG